MVCAIGVTGCALNSAGQARVGSRHWIGTVFPLPLRANGDGYDPNRPNHNPADGSLPQDPGSERSPRSLSAQLGLARLDQLAGRVDQAEQTYRQAVGEHPDSPLAQSALGLFYASEERWDQAASQLGRAVELSPDDAIIRNRYAAAMAYSGQRKDAFNEFSRAVGEAKAHYNMGYIQWRLGRVHVAEREFRRSLAIQPELNRARTMLARIAATGDVPRERLLAFDPPAEDSRVVPAGVTEPTRGVIRAIWPESQPRGWLGNAFRSR